MFCVPFPASLLTRDRGWMGGWGEKKRSGKTGQTLPATDFPLLLPQIGGNISHFYHVPRASLVTKKKQKRRLKDIMLIICLMEGSQYIHWIEFRLLVMLERNSFISNLLKTVEFSPVCLFNSLSLLLYPWFCVPWLRNL